MTKQSCFPKSGQTHCNNGRLSTTVATAVAMVDQVQYTSVKRWSGAAVEDVLDR